MTKQAISASEGNGVHALDRLRLRISAMVGSPKAQADRRAVVWRLDSDTDEAWSQVMEELAETTIPAGALKAASFKFPFL